ncbi:hypothetical protein GEOBRER4_n1931 [Citrifermentans bremense]|uniref:Uncharacterized protein n=2 Tax=Geobacteraceae TaxID=213422 RepID=A0ABQ0MJY8_9BACT|nr:MULTISPECIES: hypothetical protein [Geobacteraceae]BCG47109.1 hypothetical protein GEOBRER4_n1931 [Citrifermentans bremense]GAW66481.1 hypothetical protein GPEL0_01f1866 [Geoanaerobacter pelophilus]
MDDETFKKELLNRLDQIIELLSATLPEACLDESAEEFSESDGEEASIEAMPTYLIRDEMQDDYRSAVQKWEREKAGA